MPRAWLPASSLLSCPAGLAGARLTARPRSARVQARAAPVQVRLPGLFSRVACLQGAPPTQPAARRRQQNTFGGSPQPL